MELEKTQGVVESYWKELPKRVKVPYTNKLGLHMSRHLSRAGHEKSCLKLEGPPSKAKYEIATDSEEVP